MKTNSTDFIHGSPLRGPERSPWRFLCAGVGGLAREIGSGHVERVECQTCAAIALVVRAAYSAAVPGQRAKDKVRLGGYIGRKMYRQIVAAANKAGWRAN